jgi:hypothetical protein
MSRVRRRDRPDDRLQRPVRHAMTARHAAPTRVLPARLRNGQIVFPDSATVGTTVHTNPRCPYREAAPGQRLMCTAVQAMVWLRPRWCKVCGSRRRGR